MKEETKILCRLFKALTKAKSILGEDNWREIRRRLAEGSMNTEMFHVSLQIRRDAIAKSLGKTPEEYEELLKDPSSRP